MIEITNYKLSMNARKNNKGCLTRKVLDLLEECRKYKNTDDTKNFVIQLEQQRQQRLGCKEIKREYQ